MRCNILVKRPVYLDAFTHRCPLPSGAGRKVECAACTTNQARRILRKSWPLSYLQSCPKVHALIICIVRVDDIDTENRSTAPKITGIAVNEAVKCSFSYTA